MKVRITIKRSTVTGHYQIKKIVGALAVGIGAGDNFNVNNWLTPAQAEYLVCRDEYEVTVI